MIGKFGAVVLATGMAIAGSCAVAQADPLQSSNTANNHAALAPGDAAGVKKAEGWTGNNTALWIAGGVVVVGGIILIANNGGGHHHATSTTSGP